jgi:alpha-D-ribose 1-methylphosphonate 5-triphosphate synthase subunit PhnI
MYNVADREMYAVNGHHYATDLMNALGLQEYIRWQKALEVKMANTDNDAIRRYEANHWIKHRSYGQKKVGVVTHTYSFTETGFKFALGHAATEGIKGAQELREILSLTRHNLRDIFNTYRSSEQVAMIKAMIDRELRRAGYDSKELDKFLIAHAEKTHVKS